MKQYPNTYAVLVRRHGVYVWGNTWQEAKTMCECYDYLFEIAVKMRQMNIDPAAVPLASPYITKDLCANSGCIDQDPHHVHSSERPFTPI